jgi:hypothetical protein
LELLAGTQSFGVAPVSLLEQCLPMLKVEETEEWGDLEGEELGYLEENSVMMNVAY